MVGPVVLAPGKLSSLRPSFELFLRLRQASLSPVRADIAKAVVALKLARDEKAWRIAKRGRRETQRERKAGSPKLKMETRKNRPISRWNESYKAGLARK